MPEGPPPGTHLAKYDEPIDSDDDIPMPTGPPSNQVPEGEL